MKATVDALRAALTSASLTNYFVDVPETPLLPYVLLWLSPGAPPVEDAIDPQGDLETMLGVTNVGQTPEAALVVAGLSRTALAGFASGSTAVTGRIVWANLYDSRTVQVDRDTTNAASNQPVAIAVDMYRLRSTPA